MKRFKVPKVGGVGNHRSGRAHKAELQVRSVDLVAQLLATRAVLAKNDREALDGEL